MLMEISYYFKEKFTSKSKKLELLENRIRDLEEINRIQTDALNYYALPNTYSDLHSKCNRMNIKDDKGKLATSALLKVLELEKRNKRR